MRIKMIRTLTTRHYLFNFENQYIGYSNFTFGLRFRKLILMSQNTEIIFLAKQHGFLWKLVSIFPILLPHLSLYVYDKCPFTLYNERKVKIGEIIYVKKYLFELVAFNEKYKIQLHKGNKVTISKCNKTIAYIEKHCIHTFYKTSYDIFINEEQNMDMILFFTMFADLVLFDFRNTLFAVGTKTVLSDD